MVVLGALGGAGATGAPAAAAPKATWQPAGAGGAAPAWRGHGELAVISDGHLRLLDNGARSYVVAGPGTPGQPSWSPDGKWVAFLRTPAGPALAAAISTLWTARSDGADAHQVSAPGADVVQFAWGPAAAGGETLAFAAVSPPSSTSTSLFLASGSRPPRKFAGYAGLIGFSWAPSGKALAVSYRKGPANQPQAGQGYLEISPLDGKAGRTVYTLADNGYVDLAGWWPDGGGLLFWDDPAGSSSVAADGLVLDSLDLSTLKVSPLTTTLVHGNWVAWSPNGRTVAVVAGGDREIWYSGKHVELCAIPAATCRAVPLPAAAIMSLSPAWTGAGSLVYVTAPTVGPARAGAPPTTTTTAGDAGTGSWDPSGPWTSQNVAAWYGAQRLFTSSPAGTGSHVLPGTGPGAHDPVATSGGLLYVQGGFLKYLPAGARSPINLAYNLVGPGTYANSFYGYLAWSEDFAWHR